MKRTAGILGLIIVILAILATSGCDSLSPPASSTNVGSGQGSGQASGIWVTGQGEVDVIPDIATLNVGVEAQETSVAAAQVEAAEAMDRIMAALNGRGVEAKDIRTSYFSIRERTRWDDETGQETVTGYRVTNRVTAKIRDIDGIGGIIDAVVSAGGDLTRIEDLSFSVEDPSEYYDAVREEAMADAEDKAEKLADLADVKLGTPTYIAESTSSATVYQEMTYAAGGSAVPAPTIVATTVSPGEITVSLTVQVAYAIR